MDGVAAIEGRMAEIRGTIAGLVGASVGAPPVLGAATTGAATGVSSSGRTSTGSAFAATLAAEVASQATTGRARLNASGVPVELAAYGNGKIAREALSPVGETGHRLWAPAARAFEQLTAAAQRDGVSLRITDSYRSYESQVDVAARKGLYSQGGLAAVPGTSDHGWGRSLDLGLDAKALAWMRTNAAQFGFAEDVPREPWHWTYSPPA
ncbi:D-alanyl-D-alanine carboxypeptidase family protein [Cellulomonas fimi]|uniref:Peptidase M15 n=1 Tax=Cellulomonas fimi TaxID=1708 RepID=A0A7Y0QHV2_CELFI|nr:D-alanyl-D-alanine carboxypeptidase family protein [Cellulomonas fimi]NMR21586.1 peptidase M15 [Cellulomonas fimi]